MSEGPSLLDRELSASREYVPMTNMPSGPVTGVIPSQGIKSLIEAGEVGAPGGILPDQIQPASLDLRLGARAYRVRASFLPGPDATVMKKVEDLDGMPPMDLTQPTVLEKGAVYVAQIQESVNFNSHLEGFANPKSSTGRLDVLTRLITDNGTAFDRVDKGYNGPLFIEIAPLTFSIVVQQGTRLNQLRFQHGSTALARGEVERLYEEGQLVKAPGGIRLPLRDRLVPVTVDLQGKGPGSIVGYKAKKNTSKIDLHKIGHYDPREFWEPIYAHGGYLNLDRDDFYILATHEEVGVPPDLAAEMVPYDTASGEFRVHYAGFFDPGFGWDGAAGGSRAVLEVRSYGVSFTLEHRQIVGWLNYVRLRTGRTDKRYGAGIQSNYQGQGVALAKHFKPWPMTQIFS